jgi:zinc/manganese transport system ATP-binding protein
MGVLAPLGGSIILPRVKPGEIAYLPQAAELDRSFPINVFDLVAMGLWKYRGLFGGISRSDRKRIIEALASVGLRGFEDRSIGTLSGGQLQRMLFARLLVQDASIILLDEPFTSVDAKTIDDLVDLVAHWHKEGRTILAVLHDFELVRQHFPETLLLAREKIAWGETKSTLHAENLMKARTMIEAFDRAAHACERVA